MTQTAQRFLFDHDFGGSSSFTGSKANGRDTTLSPDALAALEGRFEEGRAAGIAEAQESMAAQAADNLAAISATMRSVSQSLDRELARIETDAIHMAATLARLYADALIERDPAPVIADAIRKCSTLTNQKSMLTVTIGENAPASVHSAITGAAADAGFSGLVSVRQDAALAPGDVHIAWPDGGYLRERTRIDSIIRTLLELESSTTTQPDEASA